MTEQELNNIGLYSVIFNDSNELQVIETGVGLEFELPDIKNLDLKEDFNYEIHNIDIK